MFPETNKVETFMKGKVELVEYAVQEESPLVGLSLGELYRKFQIQVLVCAVKRKDEVYIPDGDFVLQAGDKMHIAASHQNLKNF